MCFSFSLARLHQADIDTPGTGGHIEIPKMSSWRGHDCPSQSVLPAQCSVRLMNSGFLLRSHALYHPTCTPTRKRACRTSTMSMGMIPKMMLLLVSSCFLLLLIVALLLAFTDFPHSSSNLDGSLWSSCHSDSTARSSSAYYYASFFQPAATSAPSRSSFPSTTSRCDSIP